MRPTALLVAAALAGFGATAAHADTDHYLFVAGGYSTSDDEGVVPDGVDNELDARLDRDLRSVLVADVDTEAKTVTNWRRAGLLPLEHPDTEEPLGWGYMGVQVNYLNGRIYVGPGTSDASGNTADFIAWADINPDGSLEEFQTSERFPSPPTNQRIGATALVEADGTHYIYQLGGNQDETGQTNRIIYAPIDDSTGAVGSWSTATLTLPTADDWFNTAVGIDGTLVHISGHQPGEDAEDRSMRVDLIIPQANGDLTGSWASEVYSTDYPRSWDQGIATAVDPLGDTYLYILGGAPDYDHIYFTDFAFGLTGVWQTATLPEGLRRSTAASANDMIVMPGGSVDSSSYVEGTNTVRIATVGEGGDLTWEDAAEPMMQERSFHGAVMAPVEEAVSVPEWMLY